ncbi:MAG: OmpA family protein [Chloroflexia bacterium]|nr:OmpA family protein [Chloroflexia bacterium]
MRVDDKTMLRKRLVFDTKNVLSDTTMLLDTIFLKPIPKEPLIVKNIYFEFGKATLTPKSKEIIDKTILQIMTSNKGIIVEIGAHTDYLGKSDYNLKLSQKGQKV